MTTNREKSIIEDNRFTNKGMIFMKKVKIAFIGAGSVCFCPATISDILHNKFLRSCDLEIALMDIRKEALEVSGGLCNKLKEKYKKDAKIITTLGLKEALCGADFVITAIEVERYFYWSQDFHIPRKYGFRQVYGENGGPGGLFHALRNMGPMINIAKTMEEVCPNAYLLNYTNPEAKLVTAISKASNIKVVGLCHGEVGAVHEVADMLGVGIDDIETEVSGINHFGVVTKILDKKTGKDLYPEFIRKEQEKGKLVHWDYSAFSRTLLHLYGKWVYPCSNHSGEYFSWSDQFVAAQPMQYYYNPMTEDPWSSVTNEPLEFMYTIERGSWEEAAAGTSSDEAFKMAFDLDGEENVSNEYGVKIIEAIASDTPTHIGAVNVPNKGFAPSLPDGMVVEVPALVDGSGIHPKVTSEIPKGLAGQMTIVGNVSDLLYEAYAEKSRKKLLQAILLDPTVSTYANAVALVNEMCERQKDILPEMHW